MKLFLLSVAVILVSCSYDVDGFTTTQGAGAKYATTTNQRSVSPAVIGSTPVVTSSSSSTQLSMVASPTTILPKIAVKAAVVVLSAAMASTGFVKLFLDKPSRTYGSGTVAQEYDEWTEEGILEYYWGAFRKR